MKKSKFTDRQIIAVLRTIDSGIEVQEVFQKHGISAVTCPNLVV